jgi:DNA mismatch repair protein MSH5
MTNDNIINVVGGRHPLQDLVVSTFVENDTYLVGGQDSPQQIDAANVILLTGANYSGKSVYLKQVALTVFMAHIGRYSPLTQGLHKWW